MLSRRFAGYIKVGHHSEPSSQRRRPSQPIGRVLLGNGTVSDDSRRVRGGASVSQPLWQLLGAHQGRGNSLEYRHWRRRFGRAVKFNPCEGSALQRAKELQKRHEGQPESSVLSRKAEDGQPLQGSWGVRRGREAVRGVLASRYGLRRVAARGACHGGGYAS